MPTVDDIKQAFADNLRQLMDERDKTPSDIADACGVSQQAVSDWVNGRKYPRMDKVQLLLDYFEVPMIRLVNDGNESGYYVDKETAELANMAKDNPDFQVLLDANKNLSPEAMREVLGFIRYQLAKERGE